MGKELNQNREAWLRRAIDKLEAGVFKRAGKKFPYTRVSVGLPHGDSNKIIAQYWTPEASIDKRGSIFVTPKIDDPVEVLSAVVHELVHAVVGVKAGHGPVFKEAALAVGLEGPMRSTVPGAELERELKSLIKALGPYPHGRLNIAKAPVKKQTTRMIKLECQDCGYIARTSLTNILTKGALICPCNEEPMTFEIPEED